MLAILNYHNIAPVPAGMRMPQLYVSAAQFERQLWWLQRAGFTAVTLSEGVRRLHDGHAQRCVALTFDDGYADNVLNAAPILREYGFAATCFVVSERIGSYNEWDAEKLGGRKPLMSAAQMNIWLEAGCEIGSHTCTHPDLTTLSREAIMNELVNSRGALGRITGAPISTFCYPFGHHNADLAWCVGRAGYRLAVTTRRGRMRPTDDVLMMPRVSIDGRKSLLKFLLKATTPYCDLRRLWRWRKPGRREPAGP